MCLLRMKHEHSGPHQEKVCYRTPRDRATLSIASPGREAACGAAQGTAALFWQSTTLAVEQITRRRLTVLETAPSTEILGYHDFTSHLSLLEPHKPSYGYGYMLRKG